MWVLVWPALRGGSNEYPQCMFLAEIRKTIIFFLSENFPILVVKFSIYLNKGVFEMSRFLFQNGGKIIMSVTSPENASSPLNLSTLVKPN